VRAPAAARSRRKRVLPITDERDTLRSAERLIVFRSSVRAKTKQETQLDHQFRMRILEVCATNVPVAIRCVAGVLIFYFLYLSVEALAGKYTFADIGLQALANLRVSEAIAYAFGAAGVGYGLRQRKLRRDTIEQLAARVQAAEQLVDPGRTSSALSARGTTRQEDLI
jgi:hypothetical protein